MTSPRSIEEIRATFAAMPFAHQVGLTIEAATPTSATAVIALGPATAWSAEAFQAAYVGLVADLAAGAAALATVDRAEMPLTTALSITVTGATIGTQLRAVATPGSRSRGTLTYTVAISTDRDGAACAQALVTLRVAVSATPRTTTTPPHPRAAP